MDSTYLSYKLTCEGSSLHQQSDFICTPRQAPLEKPSEVTAMLKPGICRREKCKYLNSFRIFRVGVACWRYAFDIVNFLIDDLLVN